MMPTRYAMHPVRIVEEVSRYRENTSEFPLLLKVFMRCARYGAILVVADLVFGLLVLVHLYLLAALLILFWWDAALVVYRTRFDVLTPPPYHVRVSCALTMVEEIGRGFFRPGGTGHSEPRVRPVGRTKD